MAGLLKELDLKPVYRTGTDDLLNDFYRKVLSVADRYDRGVGYFSSELLVMSVQGLGNLIGSNGKMRLVIGHPLEEEEFRAVQDGEALQQMASDLTAKLEALLVENNASREGRLKLLAYMVASNKLEIKFAARRMGMYHEKTGIIRDKDGNCVVFQGSANETPSALVSSRNSESISVYKSWDQDVFQAYGQEYINGFERLWTNKEANTVTVDIPSQDYERIVSRLRESNLIQDANSFLDLEYDIESEERLRDRSGPFIPEKVKGKDFNIYDHQRDSLDKWKGNGFKGIFELATGSGKTITAIYGAVKLYEARRKKNQNLFVVIAVPYVDLACQWLENLGIFGIYAHKCFGVRSSWASSFKRDVNYFNGGAIDFVAAVVVNKTLRTEYFFEMFHQVDSNSLMIIGDECHNHGSSALNKALPGGFYRMGLSATPFRSDEDELDSPFPNEARKRILSYYSEVIATYELGDAIHDDVLTPYKYYIRPVYLTDDEQEEYENLTAEISRLLSRKNSRSFSKEDQMWFTMLCGQRSRLLGRAKNKIETLRQITKGIQDKDKKHTLFYSGEGRADEEYAEEDIKIIDQVSKVLIDNDWKVAQFTGTVSKKEREQLLLSFKDETIDGLVAMKVLDEGIDIPACKTAYILASTRNPRQYVQRRGRILRKAENKHSASIYDFVVLPINNSDASRQLRRSEAERVNDFALLAYNKIEIEKAIEEHGLGYDYI